MQVYQFENLPNLLINDDKRLERFKSSIIKDIKYETGSAIDNYSFKLFENILFLSIEIPKNLEEITYCALHNLHGAKQILK